MSIVCSKCKKKDHIAYIKGDGACLCPRCEMEYRQKFGGTMARKKRWRPGDEKKLIDNYADMTIQELMVILPGFSQDSINSKIKRLKAAGKIKGGKDENVVQRAYEQRGKK
jgi:hypothetical protein